MKMGAIDGMSIDLELILRNKLIMNLKEQEH